MGDTAVMGVILDCMAKYTHINIQDNGCYFLQFVSAAGMHHSICLNNCFSR